MVDVDDDDDDVISNDCLDVLDLYFKTSNPSELTSNGSSFD